VRSGLIARLRVILPAGIVLSVLGLRLIAWAALLDFHLLGVARLDPGLGELVIVACCCSVVNHFVHCYWG